MATVLSPDRFYAAAFREGYAACRAGKSNIDNPYANDDGLAEAWNDGWFERCDDEAEAAEGRF
jgi:ribosome modulation factor